MGVCIMVLARVRGNGIRRLCTRHAPMSHPCPTYTLWTAHTHSRVAGQSPTTYRGILDIEVLHSETPLNVVVEHRVVACLAPSRQV